MPVVAAALCDTGPLVALFDPGQSTHRLCRAAFQGFEGRLVTTWPVLTETFYFLRSRKMRQKLWDFIDQGGVSLFDLLPENLPRLASLMEKYADLPMALADASLVVLGERLGLTKIFTLDRRDFRVYRPNHISSFEIIP